MRQKEKIKPAAASRILVPADVAAAAGCCHPSCRLPRTAEVESSRIRTVQQQKSAHKSA